MFGSLTKIPVRQLNFFFFFFFFFFFYILPGARFRALSAGVHCTLRVILNPLSLLVYNKNMSAYYMYIVVGMLQLGIHT